MKRIDAIIQMKGADTNAAPIEVKGELIFGWDININLDDFSDEQIEQFYDAEAKDEKETKQSR